MKNKELSVRSALLVSVISGAVSFINGLWVILAGTSYFRQFSPYAVIFQAIYRVVPQKSVVEATYYFLFRSGFQLTLAPLLGVLLGAVIGYIASRMYGKFAKSLLLICVAISGGIGGFLSLGIIYLNVYAS